MAKSLPGLIVPPGLEAKAKPNKKGPGLFTLGIAPPGLEPGLS